ASYGREDKDERQEERMMWTRKGFLLLVAATVAIAATGIVSPRVYAADPIKIGVLVALSGPAAAYGSEERRAVEAVAKRVNDQGGINGRPIELVIRDTKTNPTEAARLANQVILDEKVVAIIGATTGSETL